MAEAIELKAWARGRSGKGGARAERREGRVPGTLYVIEPTLEGGEPGPAVVEGHGMDPVQVLRLDAIKSDIQTLNEAVDGPG